MTTAAKQRSTLVTSGAVVFVVALLVSVALHVGSYGALSALPSEIGSGPLRSSEVEVTFEESVDEELPAETAAAPPDEETDTPRVQPRRITKNDPIPEPPREREAPRPIPVPTPEEQQPPPPVPETNALAVRQRSDDPSVPAPENPRYVAQENRRVEEETIARERSMTRDDEQPQAAASEEQADQGQGSSTLDDVASATDEDGQEDRRNMEAAFRVTEIEGQQAAAASVPAPEGRNGPSETVPRSVPAQPPAPSEPMRTIIINDGFGPVALTAPMPSASDTDPARRAMQARVRLGTGSPERFALSRSQAADVIGGAQLDDERDSYVALKRSRSRGAQRMARWSQFRSAIENYVPNVRSGNQTALNAAASPFADYLSEVHRRIHREFADTFLPSIDGDPGMNDSLMTQLEIVFNRDGTVHQVGVVRSSGVALFDYGAFSSVMGAAPYPTAPEQIVSGDGRVYVHWGFYASERQCGTFNAHPFILRNGGPRGPRRDVSGWMMPRPDAVVAARRQTFRA